MFDCLYELFYTKQEKEIEERLINILSVLYQISTYCEEFLNIKNNILEKVVEDEYMKDSLEIFQTWVSEEHTEKLEELIKKYFII